MRVVLSGDIVELRSKNCTESKFTKQNTMDTMNWLSVVFDKAADMFKAEGNPVLAHRAEEDGDAIFEKLSDYGYYDDVKLS